MSSTFNSKLDVPRNRLARVKKLQAALSSPRSSYMEALVRSYGPGGSTVLASDLHHVVAENTALVDAATLALAIIKADRSELISSARVLDPATFEPVLETLDAETAAFLATDIDPVIAKLEAALGQKEHA
jgi:hypothetical protein